VDGADVGRSVLVTGGSGYIGGQLVAELAGDPGAPTKIISLDLQPESLCVLVSGCAAGFVHRHLFAELSELLEPKLCCFPVVTRGGL